MDPGAVIALISIVAAVLLAVVGGVIKYLLGQVTEAKQKQELAEKTADVKQETIEELRRQVSEQRIVAQLQEKFFSSLPRTPAPGTRPLPPSGDQ